MKTGRIEVITGCMFSGKSEELIRRIRRCQIAKMNILVFKPTVDTRFSSQEIVSHSGQAVNALLADNAQVIAEMADNYQVIAIDEAQFFDEALIPLARQLAKEGKRVILAGLDMDFRGEPFGPMPQLMALADEVLKLTAICSICGEDANMTQRLVNGQPAHWGDPLIVIGAEEKYEARCKKHHVILP